MITWPDALWLAFATWRSNRKLLKIQRKWKREWEREQMDQLAEMCKEDREMLEEFDRLHMESGQKAPAQREVQSDG